jgi:cytochrome c553
MRKRVLLGIIVIGATVLLIQSCEVNRCNGVEETSTVYSRESPKMTGNCMNCHSPNGNGKGCFIIGGSVYDTTQTVENPYATIMFYTQPNGGGQLVATLDVDSTGNFYTTNVINFNSGLYPAIMSKKSKEVQYMPSSTVTGACGSCHGVTNARIWVN